MKTSRNLIFGIGIVFLFFNTSLKAQILQTQSEIIQSYGTPFCSGIAKNGDNFLLYKIPVTTEASGTYSQRKILFFKKSEDGWEVCYKFKILEPSSETANNISSFSRDLVPIKDYQWKDYSRGITYNINEGKGVCQITAEFENDPGLVKVYKFH